MTDMNGVKIKPGHKIVYQKGELHEATCDVVKKSDGVYLTNWSDNNDKLLVKTQPTALIDDQYMKSQWHVMDVASKKITTSFATEGKLGAAEFSHDGQFVAILGAEDKHDPATGRLYLAESNTGKITEWIPNFMGHISDIELSNRKNVLNFTLTFLVFSKCSAALLFKVLAPRLAQADLNLWAILPSTKVS